MKKKLKKKKRNPMSKAVSEKEVKFYPTYLDALMNENYELMTLEYESLIPPTSISIEIKGVMKDFRLKSFKRQKGNDSFIENAYILIS